MTIAATIVAAPPHLFAEWRAFYFGRCADGADPHSLDWDFPALGIELARCFVHCMRNAKEELAGSTDAQLAYGLRALLMGDLGATADNMTCVSVRGELRLSVIDAIGALYRDVLDRRARPVLGHLGEGDCRPLDYVVYMLWDDSPVTKLIGVEREPGRGSALVEVLSQALSSEPGNPACAESILHGLGHMAAAYPAHRARIVAAIDRFLSTRPMPRPELKAYAEAAMKGLVQ
jgi:hypothetical protein